MTTQPVTPMSAPAPEQFERRHATRYTLSAPVQFLLRGEINGEGLVVDISESGLAMCTDVAAMHADSIILYVQSLGRFEGQVARVFEDGIGVAFFLSPKGRAVIRKRITAALDGIPYFRIVEERLGRRFSYNIESSARLGDSSACVPCTIIDMSKTGCLVRCAVQPEIGERVVIGILRGVAVRHTEIGFAIEFIRG
ncbi:MAG: PilZ domain-containing protein [Parvularculaceae bacterium]